MWWSSSSPRVDWVAGDWSVTDLIYCVAGDVAKLSGYGYAGTQIRGHADTVTGFGHLVSSTASAAAPGDPRTLCNTLWMDQRADADYLTHTPYTMGHGHEASDQPRCAIHDHMSPITRSLIWINCDYVWYMSDERFPG